MNANKKSLNDVDGLNFKKYYVVFFLVVFTVVFRGLYVFTAEAIRPEVRADSLKYVVTAINLNTSGDYSSDMEPPLKSSTRLAPGYPFFLAGIRFIAGENKRFLRLTKVVHVLIGALSVVMLYLIASILLPNALSVLVAIIFSLYPHHVIGSGYILTETVFTFLVLLGIYLLILFDKKKSNKLLVVVGLVFSFAIVTRPIVMLFLPLLTLFYFFIRRDLVRSYVQITAISFFFWIPWIVWSNTVADVKDSNVRAVVAYGLYPDFTYDRFRGIPNREDPQFQLMQNSWGGFFSVALARIKNQPGKYFWWYVFGKPIALWDFSIVQGQGGAFIYPIQSSLYDRDGAYKLTYWLLGLFHPLLVYVSLLFSLFFVVYSLLRARRANFSAPMFCSTFVIVYATFMHVPLASLPRFSVPFQPFAILVFVSVVSSLVMTLRRKSFYSSLNEKIRL